MAVRDWRNYTGTWVKKIEEETAVQIRVLRLRGLKGFMSQVKPSEHL
jgi:hypothetical protein